MRHSGSLALLVIAPFSLLLSGAALGSQHDVHERMMNEHAATAKEPDLNTQQDLAREVRALRARVATLEALKPGFTNFMPDFAERFHVMHRAGDVGDWAVASHELLEMQRIAKVIGVIDPQKGALMKGFMAQSFAKLSAAMEHSNRQAFDKALTRVPNFPMALWGKGMILLREKQDYVGARETLAKLLRLLPAGAERSEVEKILAGVPQSTTSANQKAGAPTASTGQQLSGRITIDPKLQGKVNSGATLFIIARPAGSTKGPPLAVKKIDRPVFPLSYSLGPENVMMQGLPFSGKVTVVARIDGDGNPTTREAGDLSGDYKKNPATVGANNIDIVIDQVAQ